MRPIDWVRGEIGQHEIAGVQDNPRINWYHSHCKNIEKLEKHDEVAWCSSILNAAADETGHEKTDNALAKSWEEYGEDTGQDVPEGAIVVVMRKDGGRHVCLANGPFNRKFSVVFEAIGGNQSDSVCLKNFLCVDIVATRLWITKRD